MKTYDPMNLIKPGFLKAHNFVNIIIFGLIIIKDLFSIEVELINSLTQTVFGIFIIIINSIATIYFTRTNSLALKKINYISMALVTHFSLGSHILGEYFKIDDKIDQGETPFGVFFMEHLFLRVYGYFNLFFGFIKAFLCIRLYNFFSNEEFKTSFFYILEDDKLY